MITTKEPGRTWFIDTENGSNRNDGKTVDRPIKSLDGRLKCKEGDVIFILMGSSIDFDSNSTVKE